MSILPRIIPPDCPICRKRMLEEAQLGVARAIKVECDRISQGGCYVDKYVCNNKMAFDNQEYVKKWEQKFKNKLDEIEKSCGLVARKWCEKNGFNGTIGELKKRFGKMSIANKLKGAIKSKIGIEDKDAQKRVNIVKRPPDYVACPNHYAIKTGGIYHEKQTRRALELLFMTDMHGNVVRYKPLLVRIIFPSAK